MKITVIRNITGDNYTMGSLYVDGCKLCNTLEPSTRDLHLELSKMNDVNHRCTVTQKALNEKMIHGKGNVAIPTGIYSVKMQMSSKFKKQRPYVQSVPGFSGIMFHEGNSVVDTLGCILLGDYAGGGHLVLSKKAVEKLCSKIREAEKKGEPVQMLLKESFDKPYL